MNETNPKSLSLNYFPLDRLKVFQLLIKNKADVNMLNDLGETTLFFIARYGGDFLFKLSLDSHNMLISKSLFHSKRTTPEFL